MFRSSDELPILVHGSRQTSGFRNIIKFLREYSNGQWDLGAELDEHAKANCTAFSALLDHSGRPLLDLSLFVSYKNYTEITRPRVSAHVPWPLSLSLPHQLREQARQRSHHLGVSSLDVDFSEDSATAPRTGPAAGIPPSLAIKSRSSVRDSVQRAQQFHLDGLTTSFAEPLQGLLGHKRFMLSDTHLSSLDCLVSAYLTLALLPELPQPWLADTLRRKFGPLCDYAINQGSVLLSGYCQATQSGFETMNEDNSTPSGTDQMHELPDRLSRQHTMAPSAYVSLLFERTIRSIPFVQTHIASSRLTESFPGIERTINETEKLQARTLGISAVVAGAAAGVYFLTGPLLASRPSQEDVAGRSLDSFGEAGAALAVLPSLPALR